MKTIIKIALGIGIVLFTIVLGFYFYISSKKHVNYEEAKAELTIQGLDLYKAFSENALSAAKRYNGKIVKVVGVIDTIEIVDSLKVLVMHFNEGFFGQEGVRCSVIKNYPQEINVGQEVVIKGYCTGYSGSDVIVEHAIVDKETEN